MITIELEDETLRRVHDAFGGEDTSTLKRLHCVLKRMILYDDTDYVDDYTRTSPETQLFLQGVNTEGSSVLVLAACEEFPLMVKCLLGHGADIDHQNKASKSPFMEAALWGRIENLSIF